MTTEQLISKIEKEKHLNLLIYNIFMDLWSGLKGQELIQRLEELIGSNGRTTYDGEIKWCIERVQEERTEADKISTCRDILSFLDARVRRNIDWLREDLYSR